MFIQEKLKMCKFPSKASVQKSVENVFAKIMQSGCFCYSCFPKSYKCWNPMIGSRSNYRFSLVLVNKAFMPEDLGSRYKSPAFCLRWWACVSYISQKMSFFELSQKNDRKGGSNWLKIGLIPPPRVNRVKITLTIFPFLFQIKKVEIDHKHIRALKETLNVKKDSMPDMYQVIQINLTKIVRILYHLTVNFAGKIETYFLG